MRLVILSLLISLFILLLADYPAVYGRGFSDRSFQGDTSYNHAASFMIWIEKQVSLGSNNFVMGKLRFDQWLWKHLGRNSPITMVTMASLQRMNTVRIVIKKLKRIFFNCWWPASECAIRTWNPNHNVYGANIHGASPTTLYIERHWCSFFVVMFNETFGMDV